MLTRLDQNWCPLDERQGWRIGAKPALVQVDASFDFKTVSEHEVPTVALEDGGIRGGQQQLATVQVCGHPADQRVGQFEQAAVSLALLTELATLEPRQLGSGIEL